MSELVSKDTDGTEHFHWIQEREQSCGPACVFMIERIKRLACTVGGEARIRDIASRFPKGYDENNGTHFEALKKALDQIGLSATAGRVNNMKTFAEAGNFPFIARVGWTQGGGHFVVAARTTSGGNMVCLDPWFGLVETPLSLLPNYSVHTDYKRGKCMVNPQGGSMNGPVVYLYKSPFGV